MGKIKQVFRNLSLRKSIVMYIVFFAIIAIVLSLLTSALCNAAVNAIKSSYPITGEKYYLTNSAGEQLGDGTYLGTDTYPLSAADERKVIVFERVPFVAVPLYSALCVIAAALLFYRNKLKKPLALLSEASAKIADDDLEFSIGYGSKDEMGKLCNSFEKMRSALMQNNKKMWRQMEERKRLNAAFAHDLRTPLTVLKGYTEILQADSANSITATMSKNIVRLERYIDSMSNLQRMEDITAEYKETDLQGLILALQQSASVICEKHKKTLLFKQETLSERAFVDSEIISQVFDNLVSNAVRYSGVQVAIEFFETNKEFSFSVTDDGSGFSAESLRKATEPYYTEDSKVEHFGIGLYICKVLCEHHDGYLEIKNADTGGQAIAIFGKYTPQ